MQGYLDHLETSGHLVTKKNWTRRFCRLNEPFHGLELFADETMKLRTARLELAHAQVATADELGELLFATGKLSAKIPIENSRRFVFRIALAADEPVRHYFCAELATPDGVDTAASRSYLDSWLRALRATVLKSSTPAVSAVGPLDLRELHVQMAKFAEDIHVSAHVTARRADADRKGQYEVAVVAWTLERELVRADDDAAPQWTVLEYARSWTVLKTSEQFRAFDEQLRFRFHDELRDLALPSFTGVRAFLNQQRHEDDSERRVARYDGYWRELLALPALSAVGSDAGAVLDAFLELSPHVQALRKLTGLKMKSKTVVSWPVRERFEQLYNLHVKMARAHEERRRQQSRRLAAKTSERARAKDENDKRQRQHHQHIHSSARRCSDTPTAVETPPPSPVAVVQQEPEPTDSVHDRIARIGHKLLVEAFHTTSTQ